MNPTPSFLTYTLQRLAALTILAAVTGSLAIRLPETGNASVPMTGRSVVSLDLAGTLTHYQQGTALFVDARGGNLHAISRIPGSIPLDPDTVITAETAERIRQARNIVVYCTSSCGSAGLVAGMLLESGAKNVSIYAGGWDEWVALGQPIETKRSPL